MKIIFPWFPKELNPNSTCYFRKKAQIKALYRTEGYNRTMEALQTQDIDKNVKEMRFTFYKPDNRHRDADNMLAAMKSGIDGMADALGINDRQFKTIVIHVADKIGGYIEVELL